LSVADLLLDALDECSAIQPARSLWPGLDLPESLVTPLTVAGERIGLLCMGSPPRHQFTEEEGEMARAIAHLAAVALKRADLIEGLTNANIVKGLFGALATGATELAEAKATEVGCDLGAPYLIACAEPVVGVGHASSEWRSAAEVLRRALAELGCDSAVNAGPGPIWALLSLGTQQPHEVLRTCREFGHRARAAIGVSDLHTAGVDAARAYREALDAATIGRALLGAGGAMGYSELGAYRYLVQIGAEDAPRDRMRAAVDQLIAYDNKRRTALLDTLERYLGERRSLIESARALFIHPNTLRQRLDRVEELTGLNLTVDDLLALELAIKLARLHRRPSAAGDAPLSQSSN
jgi:hypothetical protein